MKPATRRALQRSAALRPLACGAAGARAEPWPPNKNPPTIKDLEAQQVDVNTDPPKNVDANKTMDSYKRFLDLNAGDAALRAEALRRLGDLNLESSESERIERELVTNEGLRATEAIHLYSALLKTYPKYERNDSVLYQLARAYELNAQPDKALASLDQLVAQLSQQPLHRRGAVSARRTAVLGQGISEGAGAPTRRSSRSARSSAFYNQSLYKHGWSLFKQGENERSLDSFAGVLDSVLVSKRDPSELIELETLSRPNRELVEDTFRVMSITFSYLDGPKTIDEFVKRHTPQASRGPIPICCTRAWAICTWRRSATRTRPTATAPSSRRTATTRRRRCWRCRPSRPIRRAASRSWCCRARRSSSRTTASARPTGRAGMPKNEPKVVAVLKTNLKDVAQYYHAQAQRTKNVADYQEAAKWYRSYLTSFPDDPDSAVTNFLLADTLFESKQYLDAAKEYESTAYHYGDHEKAAAAGYAADRRLRQAGGDADAARPRRRCTAAASTAR